MSKALELIRTLIDGANEYEKETGNTNPTVYLSKNNLLIIQQSLKRLESIDNSNPSEALECLESIKDALWDDDFHYQRHSKLLDTIEQALLKAQEPKQYVDELKLVEKKLKALEIIKEKECDVRWLKFCIKGNAEVETYNSGYPGYRKKLTEEEFDLLKEVLE